MSKIICGWVYFSSSSSIRKSHALYDYIHVCTRYLMR